MAVVLRGLRHRSYGRHCDIIRVVERKLTDEIVLPATMRGKRRSHGPTALA